ncbi:ankyrin repeat domain-containing protein [Stenotrophomonas maltophilia]|nr:ankyrin repeat domain-containing protein [Stenotrophomonas maltophilia]
MSKSIDSFFNDEENSASAKERATALNNLKLNSTSGEISLYDKLENLGVLERHLRQQHEKSGDPLSIHHSDSPYEIKRLHEIVFEQQIKAEDIDEEFISHMVFVDRCSPSGHSDNDYLRDEQVNPEAKRLLIELGADADKAERLDLDHLTYQLNSHIQEVNDLNDNGKAANYDVDLIDSLIHKGADVNGKYHSQDYDCIHKNYYKYLERDRRYPIAHDIRDWDVFEHFIEKHVTDLDFTNEESPLTHAVAQNDLSKVQYLIDKGASIDPSPKYHDRGMAFWCNSVEMVELLGNSGFDFNQTDDRFSAPPLTEMFGRVSDNRDNHDSIEAVKNIAIAEKMIQFGADINKPQNDYPSATEMINRLDLNDHFKEHLKAPTLEASSPQRKQEFKRGFAL